MYDCLCTYTIKFICVNKNICIKTYKKEENVTGCD